LGHAGLLASCWFLAYLVALGGVLLMGLWVFGRLNFFFAFPPR